MCALLGIIPSHLVVWPNSLDSSASEVVLGPINSALLDFIVRTTIGATEGAATLLPSIHYHILWRSCHALVIYTLPYIVKELPRCCHPYTTIYILFMPARNAIYILPRRCHLYTTIYILFIETRNAIYTAMLLRTIDGTEECHVCCHAVANYKLNQGGARMPHFIQKLMAACHVYPKCRFAAICVYNNNKNIPLQYFYAL